MRTRTVRDFENTGDFDLLGDFFEVLCGKILPLLGEFMETHEDLPFLGGPTSHQG